MKEIRSVWYFLSFTNTDYILFYFITAEQGRDFQETISSNFMYLSGPSASPCTAADLDKTTLAFCPCIPEDRSSQAYSEDQG